jgi:hypothetical protein
MIQIDLHILFHALEAGNSNVYKHNEYLMLIRVYKFAYMHYEVCEQKIHCDYLTLSS